MLKVGTITLAAAMVLCLLNTSVSTAQTTIIVDGDVSEWTEDMRLDVPPNRPIITWHDGADGRDNSPADPEDLDWMVDLNFGALYATDDEDYLYLRVDMNERADVRRIMTDSEMYPSNQRIEVYFSTDPDLLLDFADETGMTWGWYQNGYDFIARLYPLNDEFADTTGYQNTITEHLQKDGEGEVITGYSYELYSRRPDLGVKIAWNEDWNIAEIAVPKSVLLQPQNLPDFEGSEFVAIMLMSGAENTRAGEAGDPWWSQRIANTDNIHGYLHTYEAEWSGTDPDADPTNTEDGFETPRQFVLKQNYPNPFNPTTNIEFTLTKAENVTLEVFDIVGRRVATLVDQVMPAGSHAVKFDAADLTTGIYLYKISAGGDSGIRKMTLVK